MGCPRCSYTSKEKQKLEIKETMGEKQKIAVIKEKDVDTLPTVDEECPKCKNKAAYFWTSQTRSGDESETKFFRCKKCDHTWREYR
jgi:DNA-directed RNA polymerase subunit M